MQLSATLAIPTSASAAFEIMTDRAFAQFSCDETNMKLISADVDRDAPGGITSVVRRSMPSTVIPANFRSFVGSDIEMRQTEVWSRPQGDSESDRTGTFNLEIVGAPVRIAGRLTLTSNGSSSTLVYSGDVSASIPFFGATIEKSVAQAITQVLADVERLFAKWIEKQGL